MTKIDIISGFLGAGKTTFIKKMLEEVFSGEKVVLVENEYGEVGIDGGFLKDAGIEIKELNSGCICCSLVGDFNRSLNEVIETYHPDRILIEPSGVGKLSDVMSSVKDMEKDHDVKLNALVTVVNAMKASKQMKAFGEFFNNQIANATTIVLSRTQNAKEEKLELCVKEIQAVNPKAAIITTPWDAITGEQILNVVEQQDSLMQEMMKEYEEHHHEHHHDHEHDHHHDHGEGCTCGCHDHDHHHHDHDADEVFTSWGKETPHKYTKEKIESILKIFCDTEDYGSILRAKGMVPAEDGTWIYFDMVPGEYELRDGEPDYTGRLCVIGTNIDEHKLEELFELN
jgi:G3E family GTPase